MFGIIVSEFNKEITDALLQGALARLQEHKIPAEKIKIFKVPGAVEIPFAAKHLALLGDFKIIIGLGAVIKGDTDHYEYVCQQVSYGCQKVMLEQHIPVIFGILTAQNWELALDRVGGKSGHKGKECADAAIAMLSFLSQTL